MMTKCVESSLITFSTSNYDTQSYFEVSKVIRLDSIHVFIMKIKARDMSIFLPLINNSVITGFRFLFINHISNHIIKNY